MGPQQQTDRMVQRLLGEMRAVARHQRTQVIAEHRLVLSYIVCATRVFKINIGESGT